MMGCGSTIQAAAAIRPGAVRLLRSERQRLHRRLHQAHGRRHQRRHRARHSAWARNCSTCKSGGRMSASGIRWRRCRSGLCSISSARSRKRSIPTRSGTETIPWLPEGWGQTPVRRPPAKANLRGNKDWKCLCPTPSVKSKNANRYWFEDSDPLPPDAISGQRPRSCDTAWAALERVRKLAKYMPCYDPSTGAVIALAPQCTAAEVEECIQAAVEAFPAWRDTPVSKRVQVLFNMKGLLEKHLEELTFLCAQRERQEVGRGHGRHPQGDRSGGVRLRRAAPDEGGVVDERLLRVRHGSLQRAAGRLRRHRPMELPGHDSARLDGSHLRGGGQLHGFEGGQFRAAVRPADHRIVDRGGAAAGRVGRCHHQPA
jgi:hypothetical protein